MQRVIGDVPADYAGPIWYRVIRTSYNHDPRLPFSIPAKLANPLFDESDGSLRYPSPKVMDNDGRFVAPYDRPLTFNVKRKPSRRIEYFHLGVPVMSARIHDAITSLDCSSFIFVALDAVLPDQSKDRWYAMYSGSTWCIDLLDPVANGLAPYPSQPGGTISWKDPIWFSRGEPGFAFLRAKLAVGRHLIPSGSGLFLSAELAALIADGFSDDYRLVPVGVA